MYDNIKLFTQALGLEDPWKLNEVKFDPEQEQLDIYISYNARRQCPCPSCQAESSVFDTKERTWRHLNFFQFKAYIHCEVPRIGCPSCGIKQVDVPWSRPYSGFTMLFEAFIIELAAHMPVAAIARLVGENDTRLWRLIRHYVDKAREQEDYSDVIAVGVDETSSKRGHNYVTVFVDLDQSKVIYATEGKDAGTITSFAEDLSLHNGDPDNITDVTCDMSPAYIKGVKNNLPNATITFDKFHIMKQINEAVDKVRRAEQKENDLLKSTRYIWLKNPENLTARQRESLKPLSKMNLKTVRAYNIKLSFQEFWKIEDKDEAIAYLKRWYFWATHARLEPIKSVAYMIKAHWDGIVYYISSRLNNGILEAINSLIQAAKRKARGYRNIDNLITIIYLTCGKLSFDIQPTFA